uniref:Uncharacterized protein n=1 Tax=Avena sativa TaxID=4498 RepID=A0ACD5YZP9_AVESA
MGGTVHPHSLSSRGSVLLGVRACASSSIRIDPACVAKPAAAVAKKPKRPVSFDDGNTSAKRARGACTEVQSNAATKNKTRPRPSPSSDEHRCPQGSHAKGVQGVTKNQPSASSVPLPEVASAPPKPPACSMRELLEKARLAKARSAAPAAEAAAACRRREIELLRAEARRKMDQVVRTVEFNDPFIDYQDAFK